MFDTEAAEKFDTYDNFGVLMKEKSYRAVNNNDIVTCIPPDTALELQGLNYQHIGTKVYINRRWEAEMRACRPPPVPDPLLPILAVLR